MILIGNGNVISRDKERPLIMNGAVLVEGTRIIKIGNTEDLKKEYPSADWVDAKGGLIMPGLINTHNHIYSAMARGLSINNYNPKGFLDILDGLWWNIDRHLTTEQTKQSAIATYIDCIKNGVTTVFDHHASFGSVEDSLFTIADAAKELGVRTCLCYEVSDRDGEEKMRASVKENANFINYTAKQTDDMLKGMMGMHAAFTISDKTFALCREQTPEKVGYHIHVAEGIEDLHASLKNHNKRIVNRLMDVGILGPKTIAAHCIYVNGQEMELLKETDTMVVHNPESNMGNACGCPPTMEIYHRGILTGLGTDGYTNDMFESYKVANILHKHNLCDATAAWGEVPAMLFEGNARIANRYFDTPLGVLREGYAADVVVADYDPLTPLTADNINGHMLFGLNGSKIVTTMINGKVLMKDRELLFIDEAKAMADCRQQALNLAKSING
ncbi:MAG: chlorohydrolase [Herbinix sp.]|nr:chlorohydrolase [Herbinix sp.]